MKSEEIKRTPGKFFFDGLELILSEKEEVIADIRSCNHFGEEMESLVSNRSREEAVANAEYIVEACNNYPRAVELLKFFVEKVDSGRARSFETYNLYKDFLKSINND